jgi:N-acetylglucosaminyl-diphospho-decaprenol L-rhamnosyltransferase
VSPAVTAVHDARRESHRSMKYFKWHLVSILRYFLSPVFFRAALRKRASGA